MRKCKVKNGKKWAIEFDGRNCTEITIFTAGRVIRSTLPPDEDGNKTMVFPNGVGHSPYISKGWWVMRDEAGHVFTLSGPPF